MPSKDELNLMWTNLADSDGDWVNYDPSYPNNLGGFADDYYWSSTEFNNAIAWEQDFGYGDQANYIKSSTSNFVRAIRAFITAKQYRR